MKIPDEELKKASGGKVQAKKFRCPHCQQMTMVVKYKKFQCMNPKCGYVQNM